MRAGASSIAPMTYVQLITASLLGWAMFASIPDLPTIAGSLVIVAAGLILWLDGRALASARER
jgi:drug/metabolite transporter (DMT)-like permease